MLRKVHALLPDGIEVGHVVFREHPGVDGFQQDEDAVFAGQLSAVEVGLMGTLPLFFVPGIQFLVEPAVLGGVLQPAKLYHLAHAGLLGL